MKEITPAQKDQQLGWEFKEALANELFDIGAVKFGNFILKSGLQSPIYFDFRILISYPEVLKTIAETFSQMPAIQQANIICGVPMAAIPLATATALHTNKPMVMPRPDKKDHGTKKLVEGTFKQGDTCCIIEDLITTGGSVLTAATAVESIGIKVHDIAIVLDREQGGRENLEAEGFNVHSIFGVTELLSILETTGRIHESDATRVRNYFKQTQV